MRAVILHRYELQLQQAHEMIVGLEREHASREFHDAPAPILWQYGHLAVCTDVTLGLLGTGGFCPPEWNAQFGTGSRFDAAVKYPPLTVCMAALERGHNAVASRLLATTDQALDAAIPMAAWQRQFPSVGHALVYLLTSHEAHHLAQISDLRRRMGLSPH